VYGTRVRATHRRHWQTCLTELRVLAVLTGKPRRCRTVQDGTANSALQQIGCSCALGCDLVFEMYT
jgi:hypothetical protein